MKIMITAIISCILLSCGGTQKSADTAAQTSTSGNNVAAADEKKMLQAGTEFRAGGSSPVNWFMEMNYDKNVSFNTDDGLAITFAFNKLTKSITGKRTVFSGKISAGEIVITTEDGICTNPQERTVYNKIVSVILNGKQYSGCGKFLADTNLEGKWQLEKIGNTAIVAAEYNKVPMFNFDLGKSRVSGNDGCNSIGGTIEVQGSRIQFSQMLGTKMACLKNKSIEGIVGKNISGQLVDYYFKEGKLYLYLPDDSLLVFGKPS